jgi:hypothetical protein
MKDQIRTNNTNLIAILDQVTDGKFGAVLRYFERLVESLNLVRSVFLSDKFQQISIGRILRERRRAEPQIGAFRAANTNALIREDLSVPVVARGDVDNQAGCHT